MLWEHARVDGALVAESGSPLETPTDAVAISVIDHGAGTDETEQERIFLPF